jgi:hypothetical protein
MRQKAKLPVNKPALKRYSQGLEQPVSGPCFFQHTFRITVYKKIHNFPPAFGFFLGENG